MAWAGAKTAGRFQPIGCIEKGKGAAADQNRNKKGANPQSNEKQQQTKAGKEGADQTGETKISSADEGCCADYNRKTGDTDE